MFYLNTLTMNEHIKFILVSVLTFISVLLTSFLWRDSAVLLIALIVITILMLIIDHQKSAIIAYCVAFFFGPLSEAVAIYFGAWTYATTDILGFPVWLPFLWGCATLAINRLNT